MMSCTDISFRKVIMNNISNVTVHSTDLKSET